MEISHYKGEIWDTGEKVDCTELNFDADNADDMAMRNVIVIAANSNRNRLISREYKIRPQSETGIVLKGTVSLERIERAAVVQSDLKRLDDIPQKPNFKPLPNYL